MSDKVERWTRGRIHQAYAGGEVSPMVFFGVKDISPRVAKAVEALKKVIAVAKSDERLHCGCCTSQRFVADEALQALKEINNE